MPRNIRRKIKTLDEIAKIAADERANGRTVVHCHGVFDLVHMGHVRHFQSARAEGDVLIVTLTTAKHVNKGPGRPIFNDDLRAEMLAALEQIDWVAISPHPSAEHVIETIKPSVYVKGSDYANPDDDVTGKIRDERAAVEKHGGKVVFTRDITFSSSSLINEYLDVFDPELRHYLAEARERGIEAAIQTSLEKAAELKVLVVGDAIIDEYQYVETMGKSAKENMIATRFRSSELFAGGVFAAANHIASICKHVEILTVLGTDDSYEQFAREHLSDNVRLTPLFRNDVPTTRKCRFVSTGYLRKLFEVYHFEDSPIPDDVRTELTDAITEKAKDYDLIVVTDFGHGMLDDKVIEALNATGKFLCVNTQTNSANHGYNLITKYPKADFICIDAPEAQLAAKDRFSRIEDLVAGPLSSLVNCKKFVVTHGQQGCVVFDGPENIMRIPAFTKTVVDTVGAGDAFFAVASPLAAIGAPMEVVAFAGNSAGGIKVGIVGHRKNIEKVPLIKYVTTLLK
ncbi:MAG: adenylyltransferase/cytidyltransferase family protein [Rhodospirillales bacterium]|nr:adenylyltransferase/cytidyltransferase family protein [Rhodospirillales bacterium]